MQGKMTIRVNGAVVDEWPVEITHAAFVDSIVELNPGPAAPLDGLLDMGPDGPISPNAGEIHTLVCDAPDGAPEKRYDEMRAPRWAKPLG